jgi:glutathione synthase/RimK-type ligase-like ATP-grasp enzyme
MEYLKNAGREVVLLDLSFFPQQMDLIMNFKSGMNDNFLIHSSNAISLESCNTIWWRRPMPFCVHDQVTSSRYRLFALSECNEAFSGLWLIQDAVWINDPNRTEQAAFKPYQLRVAQLIGMKIPETLITNNPNKAINFIKKLGFTKTVYKAFSATEQDWRETRLIRQNEIDLLNTVQYAPVIFQEYIPADIDLRITIIGNEIFAAAIYSQELSYRVDYRMEMHWSKIKPYELPQNIINQLQSMMAYLGLVYAAIDMRVTPEGEYIFLEINPAGQWLFIEERTKQPITEIFAELLIQSDVK